ncbi:MAG: mannosyltransferase family protein [Trebonia sp.]
MTTAPQTPASASGTAGTPPGQPSAAAPDGEQWWRLRRTDLLALCIWATSRVVMLAISLAALATQHGTSWLGLWQRWDWDRYLTIAEYGYTSGKGPAYDSDIVAFFPGYPMVVRAVDLVVRNWVVSGLLVSLAAGAVACVTLARLTEFEWRARRARGNEHGEGGQPARDGSGRAAAIAVLLLVCAPAAVFLAAGYTESLFLAFGIPAWLAARRRHWVLAGALTALAGTVRIDGAFEAAGIAVMFLLSRPKARDWARSPALLLPLAAVGGYMAYLKDVTGDWLAWSHAEQQGWSRRLTSPVTAFRNSWNNAFGSGYMSGGSPLGRSGGGAQAGGAQAGGGPGAAAGGAAQGTQRGALPGGGKPGGFGQHSGFGQGAGGPGSGGSTTAHAFPGGGLSGVGTFGPWPFRLDILVVVGGVAFAGWAAFHRRWAELAYVGIAVVSLATSTYYMSVAREALLWWPLWIALAIWLSRHHWLTGLYIAVSSAMMIGISWLFLTGGWAG